MSNLRDIKTLYGIMNTVLLNTPATRVSIMESSNGGGVPTPGRPLNIRSLYEMNAVKTPTGKAVWSEKRPAGPQMVSVLGDLADDPTHSVRVSEMRDSDLLMLSLSMDAEVVIFHRLAVTGERMLVLSVFLGQDDELSADSSVVIQEAASAISAIVR